MDNKGWSDQLGRDFKVYEDSCHDSYPPDLSSIEDDQHENDASRAEYYNASTATLPSGNRNGGVISFRLEEQDAPTEPEIPIPLEAMHASNEAKRVLLEHPLPRARQRTNVSTEQYIPEGRLFGAYATRGEGVTQATFRFPLTVAAIICLAATRGAVCSDEGFLSAH